jgi:hypothetical protein
MSIREFIKIMDEKKALNKSAFWTKEAKRKIENKKCQ